jgi:hypothetical protein
VRFTTAKAPNKIASDETVAPLSRQTDWFFIIDERRLKRLDLP